MSKRDQEFEESVKRLVGAVGRGLADTVERKVAEARDRHEAERLAREEKEAARKARHEARKQARYATRPAAEGWLRLAFAVVLLVMAFVVRPDLWWLVFPAIFLGLGGARILSHRSALPPQPPPLPTSSDPRELRLDQTCEGLQAALASAPEHVRTFLGKPQQTVSALQQSARQLLARERQLRSMLHPDELGRLAGERDRLSEKARNSPDPVARERFAAALDALEQQLQERRTLQTQADRLEAEHTRLLASLQSLHMNVVRLSVADAQGADPARHSLQESLERLGLEVSALAEAAEEVGRQDLRPRVR